MAFDDAATQLALREKFRSRISPHVTKYAATLTPIEAQRLLAQFTPDSRELIESPGYSDDPLHEEDADIHPFPDVIRKYRNKILYLTTDECPVYCRYCTRKRKTLLSKGHAPTHLELIGSYLTSRPEIREVIFSGGDPLMLPVTDLLSRATYFFDLPTIHFLRFHTRAITTSPGLITENFLNSTSRLIEQHAGKKLTMVLHVNSAAELSPAALTAIATLRQLNIALYAQTVLLRGINDDAALLVSLCSALLSCGVQPYYLHQLDRVTGAAHFEVSENEGKRIYAELAARVPPYMLPRYVRDTKQGKYSISPL